MAAEDIGMAALPTKSDLRVRTLSAIVMVAVAAGALLLGGYAWIAFVALVATGVLWEWVKLSQAITSHALPRAGWFAAGVVYVGLAAEVLWSIPSFLLLIVILCVIATDVGAYFSGRRFGGPKIAPRISPSKTWAGLGGGMLAAALVLGVWLAWIDWQVTSHPAGLVLPLRNPAGILPAMLAGAAIAIIAQAGDFFESWMKRRAGVKDSGNLIAGHGGLFDRVDGLLAVLFAFGLVMRLGWLS